MTHETPVLAVAIAILVVIVVLAAFVVWFLLRLDRKLDRLTGHVWQTATLTGMLPAGIPFDVPRRWVAGSDTLAYLTGLVMADRPARVVELGSGLSTTIIAERLRRNGAGSVVAVEHDAEHASRTAAFVAEAGLDEWAEIRRAELREQDLVDGNRLWYDIAELEDLDDIDLLFVDGPPAYLMRDIRKPALDFFWARIVPGGRIVLDDAERRGEARFIRQWLKTRDDVDAEYHEFQRGCMVLTKKTGPAR